MSAGAVGRNEMANNDIESARIAARTIAEGRPSREMTIDDVQNFLITIGYTPSILGNAAGMVFVSDEWQHAGFVQSTRASNRRRWIQVHRLR